MKNLLLLLILVSGVAYAGYYIAPQRMPLFLHPEGRACQRMESLCGKNAPQECTQSFQELREAGGAESIRKPIACVMDAQSCGEAVGCMAAGTVNAAVNFGEQLLKGIGKGMGK